MKLYWAVWFIHLPACVSSAWNTKWTGLATMYENKVHCLVNFFWLSTYLSSTPRKSDAPYMFSNYSAEIFPNVWLLLFALRNWQGWQAAANCLLYQTLRGWRVEAAFLHQTHVSSSLAVYIRWYLEKWDQAMQVSAGAGRKFDFIANVYFRVDTIRNFQFQPNKRSPLCLSLDKYNISFSWKSPILAGCIPSCPPY